jgi:hypothetical protein
MKKVKILKSICGAYSMAYFGGEEIEVSEALAEDMVQNGYAEFVSVKIETKELKSQPEKAVKKSK